MVGNLENIIFEAEKIFMSMICSSKSNPTRIKFYFWYLFLSCVRRIEKKTVCGFALGTFICLKILLFRTFTEEVENFKKHTVLYSCAKVNITIANVFWLNFNYFKMRNFDRTNNMVPKWPVVQMVKKYSFCPNRKIFHTQKAI